jgi:hypothetical protein
MSEETPITESPQIKKIRQGLESWLNKVDWTFTELRRWLKGYELPAVGYDKEPYSWILYGFPQSEHYYREMASRIALFLQQEKPYQNLSDDYDDRLLYNLFHLSAGLGRKHELGAPLTDIFAYLATGKERRQEFFSTDKRYNLNNAFREALITNQTGNAFRDIWVEGLEGRQKSFLLGDVYSHFRGILYLSERNQPLIDEIGRALKKMADHLEPEKRRHEKFRRLLERVKEVWPPESVAHDWDQVLLALSKRYQWQDWATVRLDWFVVPTHEVAGERQRVIIWSRYVPYLNQLGIPFTKESSEELFSEILIPQATSTSIKAKFSKYEKIRHDAPFRNYESVAQATSEYLYMDLCEEEDADKEALTEIRIDTFTLVTENSGERQVKEQEAKLALAQTNSR